MEIKSHVELTRLQEGEKLLGLRKTQVETELERVGESEANVRVHRTMASWWLSFFILSVVVTLLSAYWSVSWYLGLSWEKALLAASCAVLPLTGWMVFLVYVRPADKEHRRLLAGLGLLIVACSTIAAASLGAGRMLGTTVEEERQQARTLENSDDLTASSPATSPGSAAQIKRLTKVLALSAMIAVIVLTIAGEVAAGVSFHAYVHRMTVVWTAGPFFREHRSVVESLAENRHQQEDVRLWPQRLYAQLTREGLEEMRNDARKQAEAARRREEQERAKDSLAYLLKRILIPLAIALALILAMVIPALAAGAPPATTVVVLDLSNSTDSQQFDQNLKAVEGLIKRIQGGRIVVLAVNKASFGSAPVFSETAPAEAGRFGEYLDQWRQAAIKKWRSVAATLSASAKGSDIFGAIARGALEFENAGQGAKRLIIFSDMQNVSWGFNLERSVGDPARILNEIERRGLLASLQGIEVWVLGAQPSANLTHWNLLKAFWTAYFKRAGATLKSFNPNRRLAEAF